MVARAGTGQSQLSLLPFLFFSRPSVHLGYDQVWETGVSLQRDVVDDLSLLRILGSFCFLGCVVWLGLVFRSITDCLICSRFRPLCRECVWRHVFVVSPCGA